MRTVCSVEKADVFFSFLLSVMDQCFWISLENFIYNKSKFKIKFNDSKIIRDFLFIDQNNIPLNTLIVAAK